MDFVAEMVCSALVQETVSRGVSFVLGKLEEKASQGHLMNKLEMAVTRLESALEMAQVLPIRHLSLISRRELIKSACAEAMELLDKHKQKAVPVPAAAGQEPQGVKKRKRWFFWANDMPPISAYDVARIDSYAEYADRFVRDLQFSCSLHRYNFCNNSIVRHLLDGRTLRYSHREQGHLLRDFYIWPTPRSDERGAEAMLEYSYGYGNRTVTDKCFNLCLKLRLDESTDIFGVAIQGLQLLTSGFKLAAESARGELTRLYSTSLQDIAHSHGPPWVGIQESCMYNMQILRPDPACCRGRRHGLCANNNASSSQQLSDIFPEEVISLSFQCYPELELSSRSSSCSSFDVPLRLPVEVAFFPHKVPNMEALKTFDNVKEYRDTSIQQVAEALKSDATSCFLRKPEQTAYDIYWCSGHGGARFSVQTAYDIYWCSGHGGARFSVGNEQVRLQPGEGSSKVHEEAQGGEGAGGS